MATYVYASSPGECTHFAQPISDTITVLQAEHGVIADRIKVIDEALEAINTNIDELKNKPVEIDVTDVKEEKENDKKQCRYDKQGYCREKNRCPFYHADSVCAIYLSNGICWKRGCRDILFNLVLSISYSLYKWQSVTT